MSAKLIFVRRTKAEIDIFGGEVFADVDGRKVATVSQETITYELPAGRHIIKMYKSHDYGSMIGFAESDLDIKEGEVLVLRYAPPLKTTDPGHITVSEFTSYEQIEKEVEESGRIAASEKSKAERQAKENAENIVKTQTYWWILIFVIPGILWLLYSLFIDSMIFDLF